MDLLMEGAEVLATTAQIALGIIGFAGVVIALDEPAKAINQVGKYRLLVLIFMSAGALFLSLLPFALHHVGLTTENVWRTSSLLLAIFTGIFLAWFWPASRRIWQAVPEIFHTPTFSVYLGLHIANFVFQGLNSSGRLGSVELGVYLFGLVWLLLNSFIQFGRMLFVRPSRNN